MMRTWTFARSQETGWSFSIGSFSIPPSPHTSLAVFPAVFTHCSAFSPALGMCGLWHWSLVTSTINPTSSMVGANPGDAEQNQGTWSWGCLAFKMNLRRWVQSTEGGKSEKLRNFRSEACWVRCGTKGSSFKLSTAFSRLRNQGFGVRKGKALYIVCRVQPGLSGLRDCSPAQSLAGSEMPVLPGSLWFLSCLSFSLFE